MSSWLLDTAGSGAAGGGAGGGGALAAAACAAGIADGGMSFITGGFAGGAAAAGFSGLAVSAGLVGFSAVAGSSKKTAMMRRIDARISYIEGSWTFAGCVISDSTSSTPSSAFYTKQGRILPVPDMRARIFVAQARLVPRSNTARRIARMMAPPAAPKRRASMGSDQGCESPCCLKERYVRATNDCKQRHGASSAKA